MKHEINTDAAAASAAASVATTVKTVVKTKTAAEAEAAEASVSISSFIFIFDFSSLIFDLNFDFVTSFLHRSVPCLGSKFAWRCHFLLR